MAAYASIFPESLIFSGLLPSALYWRELIARGRHDILFTLA